MPQPGVIAFVKTGFHLGLRRRGLALLLYLVDAGIALFLSAPLFLAVKEAIGTSGVGDDLAKEFSLPVWTDIWNRIFRPESEGGTLAVLDSFGFLMLVTLLTLFVWKTASRVGIINAVRDNGLRGFWDGVGRFTGKALVVGLVYAIMSIAAVIGLIIVAAMMLNPESGEPTIFWTLAVGLPVSIVVALAFIDLMYDYSLIGLVSRGERIFSSITSGVAWPFRNRRSIGIYSVWLLIGSLLLLVPIWLDSAMTAGTWITILLLTGLQQVTFYCRSMVSIGWISSEVEYYESVKFYDEPLIANSTPSEITNPTTASSAAFGPESGSDSGTQLA